MIHQHIISCSLAPYDGWDLAESLASLRELGVRYVEPAFITNYTEPFNESVFDAGNMHRYADALEEASMRCVAMSAHMDLGGQDSVDIFRRRMDFARGLGAEVIHTNSSLQNREAAFYSNIKALARHAEEIGILIGLEGPGDQSDSLMNRAADGVAVVSRIASPYVRLNYDPGNLVSHLPGLDPVADALEALPYCAGLHIKDVAVEDDGWRFTAVGAGTIDYAAILAEASQHNIRSFSIEIPLRLTRDRHAQPVRAAGKLPLATIEDILRPSLTFVQNHLQAAAAPVGAAY